MTREPTPEGRSSAGARRQLLIGLDAMEWSLVRRWAGEGKLPAFSRLMEEGAAAELSSTATQLPDTVWTCIYAGTNPGKFSKYFYVQYDPGNGDLRLVDDNAIGAAPFWDYLSAAGRKVCVFDAPKFPASGFINGLQVANWGAHASKATRASLPPGLMSELHQRFGRHPVGDCDAADDTPRSLARLQRRILAGIELRGEVCRNLMARAEWDVIFVAFSETHCAGHHFWRFLDPTHPRYDPADQHDLGDTLESVYQSIDREVGRLLDLAGSSVRCMVFSGHGMGPARHASWNLQQILDRLGYGRAGTERSADGLQDERARVNPWRVLKMTLPGGFQYAVKSLLPEWLQNELIFRWYGGGRKWAGCRAIAVPNNDSVGAIRLLVAGRDRHGRVQAGTDHQAACDDIARAMRELRDPRTGREVVRQVTLSREEFRGPFLGQLPDLTVLWDQSFAWDEVASPRIGRLRVRNQDNRSGTHTPTGFLLARGYGAAPGTNLPQARLYDIAPTILAAAGVERPAIIDGRPLFGTVEMAGWPDPSN